MTFPCPTCKKLFSMDVNTTECPNCGESDMKKLRAASLKHHQIELKEVAKKVREKRNALKEKEIKTTSISLRIVDHARLKAESQRRKDNNKPNETMYEIMGEALDLFFKTRRS